MNAGAALSRIADLRLRNMRTLIERHGGPNNLADALNYTNASFIVQMAGPHPSRPITERTARKFEAALQLPQGWLDQTEEEQDAFAEGRTAAPPPPPRAEGLAPGALPIPPGAYPTEEDRQRLARNVGTIAKAVFEQCQAGGLTLTPERFGALVSVAVLDAVEHGEVRETRIAALVHLMRV